MKKIILIFTLILSLFMSSCKTTSILSQRWYQDNPRIEVVNESTVIFKDVVKIEIKSTSRTNLDQITYVYDLNYSELVTVKRGSFILDLSRGDYLIQSNKKITKVDYEVLIE